MDSGNVFDSGATIIARQDGAVGTRVPADLILETRSATASNSNQLFLGSDGFVGFGIDPSFDIEAQDSKNNRRLPAATR